MKNELPYLIQRYLIVISLVCSIFLPESFHIERGVILPADGLREYLV